MKKLVFFLLLAIPHLAFTQKNCEKWKVYEVSLIGPATGNPFQEVILSATFTNGSTNADIQGFYDGNGRYKIRFMPDVEGKWTYLTQSNQKALNGKKGEFICTPPTSQNHGPVVVKDTFYLAYADGKTHHSFGTTYFNRDQPRSMVFNLPKNAYFKVEIIDAWNMTIHPVEGKFTGNCMIELPQRQMTAVRFTKIN
jgi:hypothetical protein